jgi:hypothetical protein
MPSVSAALTARGSPPVVRVAMRLVLALLPKLPPEHQERVLQSMRAASQAALPPGQGQPGQGQGQPGQGQGQQGQGQGQQGQGQGQPGQGQGLGGTADGALSMAAASPFALYALLGSEGGAGEGRGRAKAMAERLKEEVEQALADGRLLASIAALVPLLVYTPSKATDENFVWEQVRWA